jgi:hypothetical protein
VQTIIRPETKQALPAKELRAVQPGGACYAAMIALQLIAAAASSHVFAQSEPDDSTRAAARALGTQGIEAYWANDFDTANTKLDRAYRLYATATLGLWSARARAQLGQLVAGAERYRETLRANSLGDTEAQQKALKEARTELDALLPRIPSLTIHVTNARADDVAISLDNTQLPSALLGEARPTDPGQHFVVATRGSERQQVEVQLREGEQRQLKIQFRAQPSAAASDPVAGNGEALALTTLSAGGPDTNSAAPVAATTSSPLKPVGVIIMAFGGAALATAAVTALIANDKRSDCFENICPPEIKQSYDAFRTVSMVSFYAGAGLAAAGLVMWLVAPSDDEAPTASLRLSPSTISVSGTF